MIAIIAHHYVVNSGVTGRFNYTDTPPQQYFLEIWGLWGKTAINSFILISGFFLCRMELTLRRYMKLVLEFLFYAMLIMTLFAIAGYAPFTLEGMLAKITGPLRNINSGFTASFLCFYAFVPFYNKLIDKCRRKELLRLILGLLFVMSGCACFFRAPTMNEPLWYMTMYLVAAYIRLYPNRHTESLRLSVTVLLASIFLAIAINVSSIYLSNHTGNMTFMHLRRYLLIDSNMPLAFIIGLTSFLSFKNMPKFHSRTVNFLAAGTFGVLLIHAASDTMRRWLWHDICDMPDMLHAPMIELAVQAVAVPVIVFVACSLADALRRRFIERPVFNYLDRRKQKPGHKPDTL